MSQRVTDFSIAGRPIGLGHPPFIVAEMSGNHNQSLERALKIVDAAAAAGAHGLKIQTYTADTMTLDIRKGEFVISDPNSLWKGKSLYELYQEAHTPWEWHKPIFQRARERNLIAFSTPFDETAVDFLEELNVPCHKIASFENTDIPLIRKVAATGKPMVISTGMATVAELDQSVRAARDAGCKDLMLLKCTSAYPASAENANIRTIEHMRELFECEIGLSDHTMGIGAAVASVVYGASLIEKHFTLSRKEGGIDSAFSLEPDELALLVTETARAFAAQGVVKYGAGVEESASKIYRRSLYVVKNLRTGDRLTHDNIRAIRPGLGLPPALLQQVLGRAVSRPVERGTPVSWDLF